MRYLAAPEVFGGGKIARTIAFQPRLVLPRIGEFSPTCGRLLGDQLINGKRVLLAFHLDPVELAQHKAINNRRCRFWSDYDAATVFLGHALEPRRDVHCLADCGIIVSLWSADVADDGGARVEADLYSVARRASALAFARITLSTSRKAARAALVA